MANLDFSASGAGASTQWSSFGYIGSLLNSNTDFINRSTTAFTANYGYSLVFEAKGTGLKYNSDAHHTLKSGTITNFNVLSGGDPVIKLSGLSATVADLKAAFGPGTDYSDARAFFKTMLGSHDTIKGSQANDYLEGFTGHDKMYGKNGDDHLLGGKGNDMLIGGKGMDTLDGGAGADQFRFDTALGSGNKDYIIGFSSADDTIALSNSIFTGIGSDGNSLAASRFKVIGVGDEIDSNDRILYVQSSGDLYFDADGSGGVHGAVKFAHLESAPTLTAADFLIV
jgi:Ca2+-binding RTX toxin-like protein